MEAAKLEPPMTFPEASDTTFRLAMLVLSMSLLLGPSQSWPDTSLSEKLWKCIRFQIA